MGSLTDKLKNVGRIATLSGIIYGGTAYGNTPEPATRRIVESYETTRPTTEPATQESQSGKSKSDNTCFTGAIILGILYFLLYKKSGDYKEDEDF